jgi:hypothetical protein
MNTPDTAWRRLRDWVRWLISPLTLAHDFRGNPVIGSPLLNGLGLHVARLLLAHCMTALRWWMLRPLMSAEQRTTFHRDGFVVLRDVLGPAELQALQAEVRAVRGEVRECIQGDTLTHRLLLDEAALRGLPVIRRLLHDPAVAGPLRYAAARNAWPLHYIQSIRNRVREAPPDPQKVLHADTFHPTMKAWFFVEDVASEHGPFTFVPGSHRLTWARLRWEYQRSRVAAHLNDGYSEKGSFRFEPEDLAALGLPGPQALPVPANTLVIANTYGIHCRGQAEAGARRLEIWSYSRLNPFTPWPGINSAAYARAYVSVLKRKWQRLDRQAAARGELSSWHPVDPGLLHAES